MKIAMFGHKRVPSREGGIEIVVEELESRMVAEGHSVTCYDVVHIHAEGPVAMCWIPKLFGKRVIITIHGIE